MTVISEQQIDCWGHPVHSLQACPGSGPVILLLHGMKFQASTWQETGTLLKLAEAGYRSVAVDMPGFGRTAASDIKPAAVVKGVLNGISRDKAILIGPSMGGRIALNFTLANPAMVEGLVLVGGVGLQENRERLKELTMPCLGVWGSEDTISPPANGELLVQEVSSAELAIIDGAPHPCYLDQPDEWHRILLGFLTEKFPV